MEKYFGTDGIRGRVGEAPITADFMLRLGRAAGQVLAANDKRPVVIGKDTRISGYMFESALEAGLASSGANVALVGPMPTPAIAYLTRTLYACAGIVISASHNPYYDNGIKFFSADGEKLGDDIEAEIEAAIDAPFTTVDSANMGKAWRIEDAAGRYIEFCKGTLPFGTHLNHLKIVVDCANGSNYKVGPAVFRELGAKVVAIANKPDGLNINADCGSTYMYNLSVRVREEQADLGIAFDGDGDRMLMVDDQGAVIDGDQLLYIIATAKHAAGILGGVVIGTVMSNLGLEQSLLQQGIGFERTPVGDRHVHQRLVSEGLSLGGESSGHILSLDRTSTGDGIISALQVLEIIVNSGKSLRELASGMEKYPHVMLNVPVSGDAKQRLAENQKIALAAQQVEKELGKTGRLILRASGTEPLVRVTVEGQDEQQVDRLAAELAETVRTELA
ncbi:MAG: phosphoglucosamine mutase [Xanthomonadales bacterium]|nr:phosphoglucosamine mutase [Xanthomonadales bacterium]